MTRTARVYARQVQRALALLFTLVVILFVVLTACDDTPAPGKDAGAGAGDAAPGGADATPDDADRAPEDILVERIAGSPRHLTATWWGYNQSKLVRDGERVVTYVLDNDVDEGEPYALVLYQKLGDGPWTAGARLETSVPGNLLLEPSGAISVLVFEPFDAAERLYWGSLKRYRFGEPNDIETFTVETIVDNDGTGETVNVRVGGAVAEDGTLYAGWGIHLGGEEGQSEVLYERRPGDTGWTRSLAGTNLMHDFYYPYVLPTEPGVAMLAVQDDYVPPEEGGGNIYHMARVFERAVDDDEGAWTSTLLADVRDLPIAETVKSLVQVSDFYRATDGKLHALTSLYLDAQSSGLVTQTRHDVRDGDGWSHSDFPMLDGSCNFVRLFEVDTRLFTLCQTYDASFIRALDGGERIKLAVPASLTGGYPFVAAPRGGTGRSEPYVDLVIISGDSNAYPDGPAYYVRIPKDRLRAL